MGGFWNARWCAMDDFTTDEWALFAVCFVIVGLLLKGAI